MTKKKEEPAKVRITNLDIKYAKHQYLLPEELERELRKACAELSTKHNRKIELEDDLYGGCGYLIKIGGTDNDKRQSSMPSIRYDTMKTAFKGSFMCQIDDIRSMIEFYILGTALGNKYSLCIYDAAERRFRMQAPMDEMFDLLNIYVDMTYIDYAVSCTINICDVDIIDNMPAFGPSGLFAAEVPLISHCHMNNLSHLATLYDYADVAYQPQCCDDSLEHQITDGKKRNTWINLFLSRKKHRNRLASRSSCGDAAPVSIPETFDIIRNIGDYSSLDVRMHILDCSLSLIINDPRVKVTRNFMFPYTGYSGDTPVIGYIEFEVGKNKFFLYYNHADDGKVHIVETAANSTLTLNPRSWVWRDKLPNIEEPIRRFLGL